jgi:hypothetical protein
LETLEQMHCMVDVAVRLRLNVSTGAHGICCYLRQRTYRISILNLTDEDNPIDEILRIEAQLMTGDYETHKER